MLLVILFWVKKVYLIQLKKKFYIFCVSHGASVLLICYLCWSGNLIGITTKSYHSLIQMQFSGHIQLWWLKFRHRWFVCGIRTSSTAQWRNIFSHSFWTVFWWPSCNWFHRYFHFSFLMFSFFFSFFLWKHMYRTIYVENTLVLADLSMCRKHMI